MTAHNIDMSNAYASRRLSSVHASEARGLTFIEHLHALSVQMCPAVFVPWVTARSETQVILMRGSCKMWSCRVCGARNARKWNARLIHHMNTVDAYGWYFLTITAHEKWRGKDSSVQNLRQGWKKLYNRMRRKYGRTDYAKVWEFHKDGSFHLHVLYARKVGKRWLRDNSRECGMGYQCESSRSKNAGQVAGYVSKYMLKSFDNADKYPRSLHRIRVSNGWTKLPELERDEYEYSINQTREGQDATVKLLREYQGLTVVDLRPSEEAVDSAIRNG